MLTAQTGAQTHHSDQFFDTLINHLSSLLIVQLTQALPVTLEGVELLCARMILVIPDQVALKHGGIAFSEQLIGVLAHVGTVPTTGRQSPSAATATFQGPRGGVPGGRGGGGGKWAGAGLRFP